MLVDEPLPGPALTVYRGTAHEFRWRCTRKGRPVPLDTEAVSKIVFTVANEIGSSASIVATLDSDDPTQIEIETEDPSYFKTFFPAALTATFDRDSYWYGALVYNANDEPEVLLLPAVLFAKPVIGP